MEISQSLRINLNFSNLHKFAQFLQLLKVSKHFVQVFNKKCSVKVLVIFASSKRCISLHIQTKKQTNKYAIIYKYMFALLLCKDDDSGNLFMYKYTLTYKRSYVLFPPQSLLTHTHMLILAYLKRCINK